MCTSPKLLTPTLTPDLRDLSRKVGDVKPPARSGTSDDTFPGIAGASKGVGVSPAVTQFINTSLSLVLFALIFAAMHGFLPDAEIFWKDAVVGGIATALLFTGGKVVIGFYIGNSDVTNVYGAAGSLAVILLWTYYSSMVVLLGAEFTKVWSRRHGRFVQPEPGAIKVRRREVHAD